MIKKMDEKSASKNWNEIIMSLLNPSYYQSYDYSITNINNNHSEFYYLDESNKKIYGSLFINDDVIKIPFGPVVSEGISANDLLDYISKISTIFDKDVIFSIESSTMIDLEPTDANIEKIWEFITPLVDTTLPIETIIANSTTNRRRIIRKGLVNIPSENIVEGNQYVDEFYELFKRRMNETNGCIDVSKEQLEKHLEYPTAKLIVCNMDDEVIAGHFVFVFGDTVVTRYNCFDSTYYKLSPSARIDYEIIKKCCENPNINNYDMSGLAFGDNMSQKELNINRYKESYNPTKILKYQSYKLKK